MNFDPVGKLTSEEKDVKPHVEIFIILAILMLFKQARKYLLSSKIKASYADVINLSKYLIDPKNLLSIVRKECELFDDLYTHFLRQISEKGIKKKLKKWKGVKKLGSYLKLADKTQSLVQELQEMCKSENPSEPMSEDKSDPESNDKTTLPDTPAYKKSGEKTQLTLNAKLLVRNMKQPFDLNTENYNFILENFFLMMLSLYQTLKQNSSEADVEYILSSNHLLRILHSILDALKVEDFLSKVVDSSEQKKASDEMYLDYYSMLNQE